jgi:hypothetical protein
VFVCKFFFKVSKAVFTISTVQIAFKILICFLVNPCIALVYVVYKLTKFNSQI